MLSNTDAADQELDRKLSAWECDMSSGCCKIIIKSQHLTFVNTTAMLCMVLCAIVDEQMLKTEEVNAWYAASMAKFTVKPTPACS